MKRETKLRGLDNQLRALLPCVLEIREEVIFHRESVYWYEGDKLYSDLYKMSSIAQKKAQRQLDNLMVKYRRINAKRRSLRIIQKCKQLSILLDK